MGFKVPLIIVFSIACLAWSDEPKLICKSQIEMGTDFKICVYALEKDRLNATYDLQTAFQTLGKINSWMSDWIPDTELNQINKNAGISPVKISKQLFKILELSQDVSRQSDGAYDPTFNVFFGLYNFKPGEEREPSDEEINERLPLINYKKLKLDRNNLTAYLEKSGMKMGLGAIGQGYGAEQVSNELKKKGYTAGFVDGSGDTAFWGRKPDGTLWTAGVRDPFNKDQVVGKFYLTDVSVTTCGDDEKFFMKGNRRVHHIIDTKTGRPANKLRQVTVLAKSPTLADAWDTACFVMGPQTCLEKMKILKLQAVIVGNDGKVLKTSGIVEKTSEKWGKYWDVKL
jgi:thiamine biosynthesis lipoprotein